MIVPQVQPLGGGVPLPVLKDFLGAVRVGVEEAFLLVRPVIGQQMGKHGKARAMFRRQFQHGRELPEVGAHEHELHAHVQRSARLPRRFGQRVQHPDDLRRAAVALTVRLHAVHGHAHPA